jgi:ketosteroid isomerase-like protein
MTQSNVELARRGYEAVLKGDLDVIAGLLDPEVKWHGGNPAAGGGCHNREQALESIRQARRRGPLGELIELVDAGDKVVVVLRPRSLGGEPAEPVATSPPFATARSWRWSTTRTPPTRSPRPASSSQLRSVSSGERARQ